MSQALRGRNLEELSLNELTQILSDIELLVRELSEELVADLGKFVLENITAKYVNVYFISLLTLKNILILFKGVRDELEYEKELKNTFISLLLSIQVSWHVPLQV